MLSNNIPNDVLNNILSFILGNTCKYSSDYNLLSNEINEYFFKKCQIMMYIPVKNPYNKYGDFYLKPLYSCSCDNNNDKKELIQILNKIKNNVLRGMKPKRVHFSKESICKSSIKYVKEFGLISSLCCNNKGIKLISNDEMFNTFI